MLYDLRRFVAEGLGLRTWTLGSSLRIALPLSEIGRHLKGSFPATPVNGGRRDAGSLDLLRTPLSELYLQGRVRVEVLSQGSLHEEVALVIAVAAIPG